MLKSYRDKNFSDNITHGFFTRLGGVSSYPYSGLNCGIGSDDDMDLVQKNRNLVSTNIGIKPENLLSLYQIHSSKVVKVDDIWAKRPQADALVTDKSGIALSILTADCAPVLFCSTKQDGSSVIGSAHAGWQGALGGVLENTVISMIDIGAIPENIIACVGPCISKSSYEVDMAFLDKFIKENEQSESFFQSASRDNHVMFDLSGYCAWRLSRAGVNNISLLDIGTYKNEKEFFSYRRSTHKEEADYGRQISVICID